jgi:hypothetical protein
MEWYEWVLCTLILLTSSFLGMFLARFLIERANKWSWKELEDLIVYLNGRINKLSEELKELQNERDTTK